MRFVATIFALAMLSCRSGAQLKMHVPTGVKEEPRLAFVGWPEVDGLMYCRQRLDIDANEVGVAGPCWHQGATDTEAKKMMSWLSFGGRDRSSPLAVPWDHCFLEYEVGRLAPGKTPARVWMKNGAAKKLLAEWQPDVDGDEFHLEVSFSPEGKWIAIVRAAVGLGDGERLVEVAGVTISTIPTCDP